MNVYLGGTFDPVHKGHVQLANELVEHLQLDRLNLVPCYQAVHKSGVAASAEQRVAMLEIATQDYPHLLVDKREVKKQKPSYTYHTLSELRAEHPDESLSFVMGLDALETISTWFNVESFCQLTNLIILDRPQSVFTSQAEKSKPMKRSFMCSLLEKHGFKVVNTVNELKSTQHGVAYFVSLSSLSISSSEIRSLLKNKQCASHFLDGAVSDYIKMHHLYLN